MMLLRLMPNTFQNLDLIQRELRNLKDAHICRAKVQIQPGGRYVQLICSNRSFPAAAKFLTDLAYATGRDRRGLVEK